MVTVVAWLEGFVVVVVWAFLLFLGFFFSGNCFLEMLPLGPGLFNFFF